MNTGASMHARAAVPSLREPIAGSGEPRVVAIFVAPRKGAAMREREEVQAVPGRGLEGDRYFDPANSSRLGAARASAVTLIEAEALEALERVHGISLEAIETRRNLVTRGAALNALVGREFRLGEVRLRGIELCEPCAHLQRITRPGVLRGLAHRGGLRAEVLSGGTIRRGASFRRLP